jgi:hypothetical protein
VTLDNAIGAALNFNEQKLSKNVPLPPTRLSEEQAIAFELFAVWCRQNGVRSLPARPTTIALYLQTALADPFAAAEAIRMAHQMQGLACPISSSVVRAVLNELLSDHKPPRSWRAEEKLLWAELPPEIRSVIARREQERDRAVRIAQCELAELRKRLEGADKSHTEEGTKDEKAS